jgi:hypothetical protein
MSRRRKLRPSFVVVTTLGTAAFAGACGGAVSGGNGDAGTVIGSHNPPAVLPDGGFADVTQPDAQACPSTPPSGPCSLPASVDCDYPMGCGADSTYECKAGMWAIVALANPPPPTCPTAEPQDGAPCDCLPANFTCEYGDAGTCANQAQSAVALCFGKVWRISVASCNPPPPLPDASPDGP